MKYEPAASVAWTQVSLILLVILSTVIVSEWVSAKVRHAMIRGGHGAFLPLRGAGQPAGSARTRAGGPIIRD